MMTTPAKLFDKSARRPTTAGGRSAARLLMLSTTWALPVAARAQDAAAAQSIPASEAAQAGTSSEATGDVSATARAGTASAGADDRSGYGDIVVTAQRVKQTLQSVPLSLQVLGNKQLEDLQVQDFADYVRYLPSVSSTGRESGLQRHRGHSRHRYRSGQCRLRVAAHRRPVYRRAADHHHRRRT